MLSSANSMLQQRLYSQDIEHTPTAKNEHAFKDKGMSADSIVKLMFEIRSGLRSIGIPESQMPVPTVVVIGAQSSGKSSVLESLVGCTFLPK